MKNEIVKVEQTQLEEVIKNSGLAIIEGEEIKAAYLPFLSRLVEIQDQSLKINFDVPTKLDETIAHELRMKTRDIRTDAEKLKDEQKRVDILRGKIKQDSYNLIASSCKLAEEVFFNVEKAREIADKKAKEQLRIDRAEKLSPYTESVVLFQLGEMSEDQFSELYMSLRDTHEKKLALEKKQEEERLAVIEAERIKNENIRLENERLKKEAEQKEKRNTELRPYIIFIRDYNKTLYLPENEYQKELADIKRAKKEQLEYEKAESDKARKAQEEKDRLADIEAKKQAQILADQKAKAVKEQADLMAKNQANIERADKERKEKEALLANIEAEKQAKLKAIKAEKKAKLQADKKAQLAPDKTKLLAFGQALNDVPRPEIKSIEAAAVMATINGYLAKLDQFILDNTSKL